MASRSPATGAGGDASLGDLFRRLAGDSATLIREEVALLRQEMKESLQALTTNAGIVAAGGVLALLALGTLTAAAVLSLGREMGYGAAALLVGAILTAVAAIAMFWGVQRLRATKVKPEKTVESLEEGKQWMKDLT